MQHLTTVWVIGTSVIVVIWSIAMIARSRRGRK